MAHWFHIKTLGLQDISELNAYIKNKYNTTNCKVFSDGEKLIFIEFSSLSPAIYRFETRELDIDIKKAKIWIRSLMEN